MQLFNLTVNEKPVNNQFVIIENGKQTFKSYNTIIAEFDGSKIKVFDKWDYSQTTLKYFCRWLEQITDCGKMNKARIEKCLKTHCITSNNADGTLNKFYSFIKS